METATLLIEEDEKVEQIPLWLSSNGYSVHVCSTKEHALQLLDEKEFSIIILDLLNPLLPAENFVDFLRLHHPLTPVLLIGDENAHEVASRLGLNYAISRPFDNDFLISSVERILKASRSSSGLRPAMKT